MGNSQIIPFNQSIIPRNVPREQMVIVDEITKNVLGRQITMRCGNEGQWQYNDPDTEATRKFLQAAISGIPLSREAGADMRNTAFILDQPGRRLIIKSGNGDSEFLFLQEYNGDIRGAYKRKPWKRYIWDKFKQAVCLVLPLAGGAGLKMIAL